MTREEIDSLIRDAKIARFCSHNQDGTIHATPVWFKYENGRIAFGTPVASRKARNVRRDGNVTVLTDISEKGLSPKCVIVYGKAEISDPIETVDSVSLFERYMAKERAEDYWRGLSKLTKWVKITVRPERMVSFDLNKDKAFQSAVGE
jgi:nitroimidazol reductase NimA-like FMN-containing flavoprotein (pyridoxamine 5'-phosphate oxidase superfamily)